MKRNPNRITQKNKSGFKRLIDKSAVLSLAGLIGVYAAADFFVDRGVDARYVAYKESMGAEPASPKQDNGLIYNIRSQYRVSRMEQSFEAGLDDLVRFVNENKNAIIQLTSSRYEDFGLIEKDGTSLRFIRPTQWFNDARTYISEIIAGDFKNKERLVSLFNRYPQAFFINPESRGNFVQGLDVLQTCHSLRNGSLGPAATSEANAVCDGLLKIFKEYADGRRETSVSVVDSNFLNNGNLYSRFHTHPINDTNQVGASISDKANTHLRGPMILFTQRDNTVTVYAISRGQQRQIHSFSIGNPF